ELTPYSCDKGADVVVHPMQSENPGLLIQVKQRNAGGKPGGEAVDEIIAAKPFYQEKYSTTFKPIVITNRTFTNEARRLSRTNEVQMYERKWIIENLTQYPVTWTDVNLCQFQTV
ncbi:MAG: restriction endonuclease, partial [Candidatus Poribacteria bacterium]|nr:restriction endonuclease [Candidatus Poribacteria bacterium]